MIIPADIVCSYPTGSLASSAFSENFSAFEHSIMRFTTTLLPLHQVGGAIPDDKYALIVIHSLAHASMIRLHAPFMHDDGVSREKCIRAARSLIHVTKLIADTDFEFLDPIIGVCIFFTLLSSFVAQSLVLALLG